MVRKEGKEQKTSGPHRTRHRRSGNGMRETSITWRHMDDIGTRRLYSLDAFKARRAEHAAASDP